MDGSPRGSFYAQTVVESLLNQSRAALGVASFQRRFPANVNRFIVMTTVFPFSLLFFLSCTFNDLLSLFLYYHVFLRQRSTISIDYETFCSGLIGRNLLHSILGNTFIIPARMSQMFLFSLASFWPRIAFLLLFVCFFFFNSCFPVPLLSLNF